MGNVNEGRKIYTLEDVVRRHNARGVVDTTVSIKSLASHVEIAPDYDGVGDPAVDAQIGTVRRAYNENPKRGYGSSDRQR